MKRRSFFIAVTSIFASLQSAFAIRPRKNRYGISVEKDVHVIHIKSDGNNVAFMPQGSTSYILPIKVALRAVLKNQFINQLSEDCNYIYVVDYKDRTFSVLGSLEPLEYSEIMPA